MSGIRAMNNDERAEEVRLLGEWDWWYGPPRYRVLHAAEVTYDPSLDTAGEGMSVCGWQTTFAIPGIFSRMSLPRCAKCCDKLGYPRGTGSPKNDQRCRPLVEQRLSITS